MLCMSGLIGSKSFVVNISHLLQPFHPPTSPSTHSTIIHQFYPTISTTKRTTLLQNPGERNYHIFYCMLAGLSSERKQQLCITNLNDYYYLTQVGWGRWVVCGKGGKGWRRWGRRAKGGWKRRVELCWEIDGVWWEELKRVEEGE